MKQKRIFRTLNTSCRLKRVALREGWPPAVGLHLRGMCKRDFGVCVYQLRGLHLRLRGVQRRLATSATEVAGTGEEGVVLARIPGLRDLTGEPFMLHGIGDDWKVEFGVRPWIAKKDLGGTSGPRSGVPRTTAEPTLLGPRPCHGGPGKLRAGAPSSTPPRPEVSSLRGFGRHGGFKGLGLSMCPRCHLCCSSCFDSQALS